MKQLTQPQLETAKQMNNTGITWKVVAQYYKLSTTQLHNYTTTQLHNYENESKIMKQLTNEYVQLMKKAEETNNRKDAIKLINQATAVKEVMNACYR